jgi:uncharacterized protein (TIGR03790 family)
MPPPRTAAAACLVLLALAGPTPAIGPDDVYLLVNQNEPASRPLAEYYCRKRGVPEGHILSFDLPARDDCSRRDYERNLVPPLREKVRHLRGKPIVLVTVYGMPIRIGREEATDGEREELKAVDAKAEPLRKRIRELDDTIRALEEDAKKVPKGPAAEELARRRQEKAEADKALAPLANRRYLLSHAETESALDSELALLWYDRYELRRWQLNLLYFQVPEEMRRGKPPLVMTARLDGPTVPVVRRMIDDAVAAEAKGLAGKVYVDAQGLRFDPKSDTGHGYGGYDESFREMARLLAKEARLPVVLDDRRELFPPGSCPECALYCGWYSLSKYVDCCRFVPGAVAWHLASGEAVTIHDPKTRQWCKNLLENGAAATLGPVEEPYTIGFPKPAEFFGFLATGEYTLVECYWKSQLFASWMCVLLGDPLYNPFKNNPRIKVEQVKPSPVGGRLPFAWKK